MSDTKDFHIGRIKHDSIMIELPIDFQYDNVTCKTKPWTARCGGTYVVARTADEAKTKLQEQMQFNLSYDMLAQSLE